MKKSRSARMGVVLDLEKRKKQQADKFLADHVQRVENDKVQLQQLEHYLNEYQQQYQEACKQGITIQQLTTYQAFMAKIGSTIEQHKKGMQVNRQHLEKVREFWTQVYARHKAVDGLIEKFQQQEQRLADKALQKLVDEASGLQFSNKKIQF